MSIKYNNLVYELKRKGINIIVLSLGEAYFDIPLFPMNDLPFPEIYHYSHSRGIPELREKIAEFYDKKYGVPVDPETEILITAGSKIGIHMSLMSLLNPGDEVLIGEPAWVSYPEQVKLCYGQPVMMPWTATVYDYEKYITGRTKVIIVNNPHNPRGEVLREREIEYLYRLAIKYDLFLLSDEAYSDFLLGDHFRSVGRFDPAKAHIVIANSISKNYGISGWRLGYIIGNSDLIYQVLKVNQHLVTCPATILEYYIARHFDEILKITLPQIESLVKIRNELAFFMKSLGLVFLPGMATFYFFVSIEPSRLGSQDFCTRLLLERHISTVPGIGYGASCDRFIRVSIGTASREEVEYGLKVIKELIIETS